MKNIFLQLVNRNHPLLENNEPKHLVLTPYADKDIYLHPQLAQEFKRLITDLRLEDKIMILDGYRTQKEQERLWDYSIEKNGRTYTEEFVAYPGCSEHQTGLAIDIGLRGEKHDFIAPNFNDGEVVEKFLTHMKDYGFILRYPKNKKEITGIGYEPWHFRYVGIPHSQMITDQQWTLEEYIQFLTKKG
ncbi:D,D-carboxypeptidase/D,D-dipeptidase VanXY [Listeria sp. PSOL-1]|uniref:D,D-carboxypeptidase/D,D-dipeptidase VanXY n=1 Tax=Listeria sp. PSOL-1 TaxID=1844999 RepID=UPI0013D17632|nr:D,D-carboxypeptidase/D,D-dipeptidase VanXY [Listeria sp. PSOL-1]